jgi:hypothetical protein
MADLSSFLKAREGEEVSRGRMGRKPDSEEDATNQSFYLRDIQQSAIIIIIIIIIILLL